MCTVTVFPLEESHFVLTTNRDEAPERTSLWPEIYPGENGRMLFPKDAVSGGTWVGASEQYRVLCLLNGGFEPHRRSLPYRKSRGEVVVDFLQAVHLEAALEAYSLIDIEPFTLVIVEWEPELRFLELVWDGYQKHLRPLPLVPHIWSSSTLYTSEMKKERVSWFRNFVKEQEPLPEHILDFHTRTAPHNNDYGVIMDRGFVKTTSITQIVKNNTHVEMNFRDLEAHKSTLSTMAIPGSKHEK